MFFVNPYVVAKCISATHLCVLSLLYHVARSHVLQRVFLFFPTRHPLFGRGTFHVHTVANAVRQFAHVPMQLPTCYMCLAIHSGVTCRSGPIDARGLHFHSTFRPSEPSLSSGLSLIEEALLHVLVIKVMRTLSREHAPLRTASFGLSTCTFHIYSSWPRASLVCTHAHLLSTRDALHHVVPSSPRCWVMMCSCPPVYPSARLLVRSSLFLYLP